MKKEIDFKLFVPENLSHVPAGVYDVVSTNETYDKSPTIVDIRLDGVLHMFTVCKFNWGHNDCNNQLVGKNFSAALLDTVKGMSEEAITEDLTGLRHSDYTVDEFIKEFGNGDPKKALIIAIRQDWDAMPISQMRADEIYFNALKKRSE